MIGTVKGNAITLEGFNNLTKTLSFNIYDVCYALSHESQIDYLKYIDEEYKAQKLNTIVHDVTQIIDAQLLHVSTQDYVPRGASVTALIAEEQGVVGHLDKSHITAHTYPEHDAEAGISTFRVDIDISTCGMISPLSALRYLIGSFDSDVVLLDYRVRGFTRDKGGCKHFIDHDIASLQEYIPADVLRQYLAYDINIISDNIFHTKMRKKHLEMDEYLFGPEAEGLQGQERNRVEQMLRQEITEIFECQNL